MLPRLLFPSHAEPESRAEHADFHSNPSGSYDLMTHYAKQTNKQKSQTKPLKQKLGGLLNVKHCYESKCFHKSLKQVTRSQ